MRNLPLVIGFISVAVAVIVALVTALLNLIAFQARSDEFALYLAVGHRRSRLVGKLVAETALLASGGWLAGIALGLSVVALYAGRVLEPRGILIELLDPGPILYSLVVPALSAAVSAGGLAWRLHRMDPVAVIQRRGP
jgi:ABC-type antimicrobial peptide transport system permease subunit